MTSILTIPNLLTFMRMALIPAFASMMTVSNYTPVLWGLTVIMLVAAAGFAAAAVLSKKRSPYPTV